MMNSKIITMICMSIIIFTTAASSMADTLECFDYRDEGNVIQTIPGYEPIRFGAFENFVLFDNYDQLVILDATDPLNPLPVYEGTWNEYHDYFFDGSYVLEGHSDHVAYYVSLTDATDPTDIYFTFMGTLGSEYDGFSFRPVGFEVVGDFFYIPAYRSFGSGERLFIYTISQSGGASIELERTPSCMAHFGDRLFCGESGGIGIIDISTRMDPQILERIELPGVVVRDIIVKDPFLFVIGIDKLLVIDLQNPGSYEVVSELDLGYSLKGIDLVGDVAFIADKLLGVHVVDISQPVVPALEKTMIIPGGCDALLGHEPYLFTAAKDFGLSLVDPAPELLSPSFHFYPVEGENVTSQGNLVFSCVGGQYRITDFSNPLIEPLVLGEVTIAQSGIKHHFESDDLAIVVNMNHPIDTYLVDISDYTNPTILSIILEDHNSSDSLCPVIHEGYGYVGASNSHDLLVFDLIDPQYPELIAEIPQAVQISCLAPYPGHLVLGTGYPNYSLQIIDVSNPESPQITGNLGLPWDPRTIKIRGDLAYCTSSGSDAVFSVISLEDLDNPQLLSELNCYGFGSMVDIKGSVAYFPTSVGIQVIDISTPEYPEWLGIFGGGQFKSVVALENQIVGNVGWSFIGISSQCDSSTPVFLSKFNADQNLGVAAIRWEVSEDVSPHQFNLVATCNTDQLETEVIKESPGSFFAELDLWGLGIGEVISIRLEYSEFGQEWVSLIEHSITTKSGDSELEIKVEPNPFNAQISLGFFLNQPQFVQLEIYGIDGRRIKILENQRLGVGAHGYNWDGCDQGGSQVSSGTYFIRLSTEGNIQTRSISLVK